MMTVILSSPESEPVHNIANSRNCPVMRWSKGLSRIADYRGMFLCRLFCLLILFPLNALAAQTWVLVNTERGTVTVHRASRTVLQLKGAAIGRGGVTHVHVRGDGSTPLGTFRIVRINHRSRFHVFFELNYPTTTQARLGYQRGLINHHTLRKIEQATAVGQLPPQNTVLGGDIGIHGLGKGSLWVHRHFNWTDGCVALTNLQIEKLARWLEIGTRVVIK
ncbi:MAG: L,D-transpeptidase [Gammaproteobacteria bacterium]